MKYKNENSLTVNLNLTDQTETSDLQAYVFSSGGKPLGSAPISVETIALPSAIPSIILIRIPLPENKGTIITALELINFE